jgi:hypothetical protein
MMILDLSSCEWNKKSSVLSYAGVDKFPDSLLVRSDKTGRVVKFIKDVERAADNEFWDGELCEYIPVYDEKDCRVKTLVLR